MRSDCSTGAVQIPAKYLKMAADYIPSPLTQIINTFISNTVKAVLSGHPWGMLLCPLNTGCPPNTGFDR